MMHVNLYIYLNAYNRNNLFLYGAKIMQLFQSASHNVRQILQKGRKMFLKQERTNKGCLRF